MDIMIYLFKFRFFYIISFKNNKKKIKKNNIS